MSILRFNEEPPGRASEVPEAASECAIATERAGPRMTFRPTGIFDRVSAWKLRALIEVESASELLLDFGQVRDCSDLALAVLAHGLAQRGGPVRFRGLRQHELRILRYCGIPVEDASAREAEAAPAGTWGGTPA